MEAAETEPHAFCVTLFQKAGSRRTHVPKELGANMGEEVLDRSIEGSVLNLRSGVELCCICFAL